MIPHYLRKHESALKNFSLHFDYFSTWDEGANLKARIEHHITAATTITGHAGAVLQALHRRQCSVLKSVHDGGGLCLEITARLATPYVSGLGGSHPTETGFILDRNTGLPYVPASSIKGVLRLAHALNLAEHSPEMVRQCPEGFEIPDTEESMRKYFGDTDAGKESAVRGQLVFLDAFPAKLPTLKRDIMNPHFCGYYNGDNPPVETENPNPIMFMSVMEGIEFKFRVLAQPLADGATVATAFGDGDRKKILEMFRRAGEELGFGAKTSVGYGRMTNVTDSTDAMTAEWRKIAEEEEARRFPWRKELRRLEGGSNWGDFRQRGIDNQILMANRDKSEVSQRMYDLACSLRQQAKSNWEVARDELLQKWFAPAGIAWPPVQAGGENQGQQPNEQAVELARLKAMAKWADYQACPVKMELLSKNGLKQLRDKLKGWGCDSKDAKEAKKRAWEELKELITG